MVVQNGWVKKSLLDCCELLQGLTYSPSNIQPYGLLVLRSSNIQNGKLDFDDCVYVNCKVEENKYVKPNDILICVRNGSSALIGKSCVIDKPYNATFGAFMSVLRGDNTGYLAHMFRSEVVQQQIRNRSNATINQITKRDFEDIIITIPSDVEEQRTIAITLSDADAYVNSLEKLIAKKQAVKQATMHELLTGKRRLPGFNSEWEVRSIGDIGVKLLSGYMFQSQSYVEKGKYKIITIANVQKNKLDMSNCSMIDSLPADIQKHQLLNRGDILISMTGNVGRTCLVDSEMLLLNQRVGVFTNIVCDKTFFYYVLQNTRFISEMVSNAKGGAQPNLSNKDVYKYEFGIPPTFGEQTAIATILSDMDAEIESLAVKLKKMQHIKQGMMSELLTGRIRLNMEAEQNGENKRS